jgi:dihydrofolate reductase
MKVFIIAALTADGFIGRNAEHLADWTSPEDKKLFVSLTKQAGTMIMGSRTFATIGRALPGRRTIVYTSKPDDFSVEGVEATNESPEVLLQRLTAEGVETVAVCGGASIYGLFMRAGVVNELYITIEPVVFGTGVTLFDAETETTLQLLETRQLNDNTVLLHYAVAPA